MLCVVVTKRTVIVSSYYECSLAIDSMTQTEVTCNFRIRAIRNWSVGLRLKMKFQHGARPRLRKRPTINAERDLD